MRYGIGSVAKPMVEGEPEGVVVRVGGGLEISDGYRGPGSG